MVCNINDTITGSKLMMITMKRFHSFKYNLIKFMRLKPFISNLSKTISKEYNERYSYFAYRNSILIPFKDYNHKEAEYNIFIDCINSVVNEYTDLNFKEFIDMFEDDIFRKVTNELFRKCKLKSSYKFYGLVDDELLHYAELFNGYLTYDLDEDSIFSLLDITFDRSKYELTNFYDLSESDIKNLL